MQVDWRVVTTIVIGFFAINGFLRGWWKEAVTTVFLTVLLILLQVPEVAQRVVEAFNSVINWIIDLLPITIPASAVQIDPRSPGTWIVILILVLGLATLIGRASLPNSPGGARSSMYNPGLFARVLGLVIGAANGFLILNLVREYLDGRSLPGSDPPETAELRLASSSAFGPPASDVSIQATNLPNFTILDSFIPWIAIVIGILILIAVIRNRILIARHSDGGRKIDIRPPYGYRRV